MMKRSLLALAAASCAGHAAAPPRPAARRELRTALAPRVVGLVLEEVEGDRTYGDGVTAAVRGQITLDPRTGRMIARTGTAQLAGAWSGHAEQGATWRETPPPSGP